MASFRSLHRLLVSLFLLFMTAVCAQSAVTPPEAPEAFLRRLYQAHMSDYVTDVYWFDDPVKLSGYFDPPLVELFLRDEACKLATKDVCALNADPLTDGQDYDGRLSYRLAITGIEGAPLQFKALFANGGESRTIHFTLKSTGDGWRISDISYPRGGSVARQLSDYRPVFERLEEFVRYRENRSRSREVPQGSVVVRDGEICYLLFTLQAGNDYRQYLAALQLVERGYKLLDEIMVGGKGKREVAGMRVTAGKVILSTWEYGASGVAGEMVVTLRDRKLLPEGEGAPPFRGKPTE